MKRSASQALALLVDEIVEVGKAKDENGQPLWPVVQETMMAAFFGAPEALLEALTKRPLMILHLIQTNKRLAAFLEHFEGLWIAMVDELIEDNTFQKDPTIQGRRTRFGDTYAFFAVMQHRIHETQKALLPPDQVPSYSASDFMIVRNRSHVMIGKTTTLLTQDASIDLPSVIVYYDEPTKLYVEILQRIFFLSSFFRQPLIADMMLRDYLGHVGLIDTIWGSTIMLCLQDSFFWGPGTYEPFKTDLTVMKVYTDQLVALYKPYKQVPLSAEQVEITIDHDTDSEIVGIYSRAAGEGLAQVKRLIEKLDKMLSNHVAGIAVIVLEEVRPVVLDKNTTRPFRDLLYREQGLYNTQQKQKAFFFAIFERVSMWFLEKEEKMARFGECIPLACSVCKKETYQVDPASKRAYCTQACVDSQ